MKSFKTSSTPEIDAIIKKEYLNMPFKQLAMHIGKSYTFLITRMRQLELVVPREIIEQRINDSRIKKGTIPPNKGKSQSEYMSIEAIERTKETRFKKGNIPHNTVEGDGAIRIRHKKGEHPYKYIRLELGKWELLHRHIWKEHKGKIPDKHIITFKDGNTMNCVLENLECISQKENAIRNSSHENPTDNRVASYIAGKKNKDLKSEFLKHPKLIEAKRQSLLLKRALKNERSNHQKN